MHVADATIGGFGMMGPAYFLPQELFVRVEVIHNVVCGFIGFHEGYRNLTRLREGLCGFRDLGSGLQDQMPMPES